MLLGSENDKMRLIKFIYENPNHRLHDQNPIETLLDLIEPLPAIAVARKQLPESNCRKTIAGKRLPENHCRKTIAGKQLP